MAETVDVMVAVTEKSSETVTVAASDMVTVWLMVPVASTVSVWDCVALTVASGTISVTFTLTLCTPVSVFRRVVVGVLTVRVVLSELVTVLMMVKGARTVLMLGTGIRVVAKVLIVSEMVKVVLRTVPTVSTVSV